MPGFSTIKIIQSPSTVNTAAQNTVPKIPKSIAPPIPALLNPKANPGIPPKTPPINQEYLKTKSYILSDIAQPHLTF